MDLTLAWAGLLVLAVFIYVVLDGFDLGIGMLFALFPARRDRDLLMNSVAPVWDGNETWLVLGGGGLFAAFPMAYGIYMTALYAPIIAMLLALVFRGVAFEYRWRTERWRRWWDRAFILGSAVAALAQGIALGAVLQGITVDGRSYGGGWWDWLTPFTLLTGVAVAIGYVLLGACWLVLKTEGEVHDRARRIAVGAAGITVAMIGAVSLATPFLEAAYWTRWFTMPTALVAAPVPVAVAALSLWLYRSLTRDGHDLAPFLLTLGLFALCFAGLCISLWPYIIPTSVTLWEAAAPPSSQWFMLVGAMVMLPLILGYTGYAYWVFRGKLDPDEGYH
ncbi:cytochrome d ubiquinol oxidase subunit II [Pseudohaliea rubra]|uniref:Putative Cytochrome bd2, subunit II n=1 Tax=Pseudohaliea rubra DSM 19751 TaxID=1265313 RepID=A0A095VUH7_9GAMM|nr:cytochrome d ubiquinol oxidase subunit II [Pseudohaliea rubra]KGE05072.1 putative Cytochrome bd2, subunit II [Pseudohaliea rubra DSM 19751]